MTNYVKQPVSCLFLLSINERQRIPKGQSKMDNPEKLATQGAQYEDKIKTKDTHNMCWASLCANKYK